MPNDAVELRNPQKRISLAVSRSSDNQPVATNPVGAAPLATGKRAQVGKVTVPPLKAVLIETVVEELKWIGRGSVCSSNGRPVVAEQLDSRASGEVKKVLIETAVRPAERAEINELVVMVLFRLFLGGKSNRH